MKLYLIKNFKTLTERTHSRPSAILSRAKYYLCSKYCFSCLLDAFIKFHYFLHFPFAQKEAIFVWKKLFLIHRRSGRTGFHNRWWKILKTLRKVDFEKQSTTLLEETFSITKSCYLNNSSKYTSRISYFKCNEVMVLLKI